MKVAYFVTSDGGCDYYRAVLPMTKCAEKEALLTEKVWPNNVLTDIQFFPENFAKYMAADLFLMPRIIGKSFIKRIQKTVRESGRQPTVVVDYDDDVFNVSPLSPHYVDYGVEGVRIKGADGTIKDLWKDGLNIDLKKNQARIDEIKWSLENADMVTTTTEILADAFRQYNDNVRVLPNCVDLELFTRVREPRETVDIFWAGGYSHYEDWYVVKDAITEVMNKYKHVRLVVMGTLFDSLIPKVDKKRVRFHPWVDTNAYPFKLSLLSPDICIIPLRDTPFNRRKSAIKWIEMGALGIPSVSSFIPPYADMEPLKKDNGVYIEANDKDGWVKGLSMLIEDENLRKTMGENAKATVQENFDINKRYHDWVVAYQEAICRYRQTLQPVN